MGSLTSLLLSKPRTNRIGMVGGHHFGIVFMEIPGSFSFSPASPCFPFPFSLFHSLLVAYYDVIATIFRWRRLYVGRFRPLFHRTPPETLRASGFAWFTCLGFDFRLICTPSFGALCRKASFVNRLHFSRSLPNGLMNSLSGHPVPIHLVPGNPSFRIPISELLRAKHLNAMAKYISQWSAIPA